MNRSALGLVLGGLCFAAAGSLSKTGFQFQIASEAEPASAGILGEHELQAIDQMPSQQQAERLLERAISRYRGALQQIDKRLPSWDGKLLYSKKLQSLIEVAYNSSELPVRAAALELTLNSNRVGRDEATVRSVSDQLKADPQNKPWRLWILGLLANRGVETESIKRLLVEYMQDPKEETRQWAVDSLAMLGTDDIIEPLLTALGTDPSPVVRERAGCSLAESGMMTRVQRARAIPGLLLLMDNPTLDRTTQTWVFQALREISGQNFAENRAAWRDWSARRK